MKHYSITLMLLAISGALFAQADSTMPAAADSIVPEKSAFTLGVQASSNASYYGQKSEERTPYVALAASYQHRSGFYVNSVAYRLLNDSARLASAYSAGAGFIFKLSESFSADLSYNYTFFPKLSPFLQASNPHMASATLTLEKWITASLNADYAFGKSQDLFITPGISKQISLFRAGKGGTVIITPLLDLTAGTQRFYEYYQDDKKERDSVLGKLLDHLPIPFPGNGGGNNGSGGNNTGTEKIRTSSSFDLLSYNLKLPLAYVRSNLMFELNSQFSLLSDKVESNPGKLNSFFTISFYYQFR